ncbi:MAG: disulfide bond formation protein B [Alphaproteobacteria bacterium]|nr:disulfide bond formation protein B [Alphaproteobacteria bacterium]
MTLASISSGAQRSMQHPLFAALAIAGLGVALLLGAYAFQYLGGFKPCPLCLEQRWPWRVLIGIGAALFVAERVKAPAWVSIGLYVLAAFVALYGAYLGGYHAGVEYKWWPGPKECSGDILVLPTDGGVFSDLSTSEIVRCDAIVWSLFWISMAGYNFLFSLLAAALAGFGVWKELR